MQSSTLTTVLLPLALGIIMLGLGLSLTIADFKRVVVYPRAVLIGLVCQMLLLPVICYGLAVGFGLPPELAVGLMLLAASPAAPRPTSSATSPTATSPSTSRSPPSTACSRC